MRILRCEFHAMHWYQIWQIIQTITLHVNHNGCYKCQRRIAVKIYSQNIYEKRHQTFEISFLDFLQLVENWNRVSFWNFEKLVLRFNRFRIGRFSGFYFKQNCPSLVSLITILRLYPVDCGLIKQTWRQFGGKV